MYIVGQEHIQSVFKAYRTNNSFPQFVVLEGPKGQGKQSLALSLTKHYQFYTIPELKVDAVREMIEDSYTLNEKKVYLIPNADDMTIQAQNALLKFCEEPSPNAIIIMTVQHIDNVLSTIRSRATVHKLQPYTKEQLKQFTTDETVLAVCENPGQIIRAKELDFPGMLKTAKTVVDNIGVISAANAFNIPRHFELENVDIFIQMVLYLYSRKMLNVDTKERHSILAAIRNIMKFKSQLQRKSINKSSAVEMMFVKMREGVLNA